MSGTPEFFDDNETPTAQQESYGRELKQLVDDVASLPAGTGKTWLLNRLRRYITRVDPHTEELIG